MIDLRNYTEIMEAHEQYKKLESATYYAEIHNKKKWKAAIDKCSQFNRTVYALAVFRTLSLINPTMINRETTTRMLFREAFGDDFNKLDDGTRGQLIKLVDWGWSSPWVIEESVTTVKGEKITTIKMLNKLKEDGTVDDYDVPRKP